MASPRVFIQGGKRPEYVTSVHGMDSAEAAGEGSKKLNHQKMLDYFAKQVGCSATLESDANGSVYVFDGDCRTKIVSLLQSMEKLPFHSDPDSVVVNDYEFEVPEDEDVCQFEAASVFPYVLPPAGPFVEVHWLCADAPEDVGCKVPELECDEDGLINAWDDLTDAKDDIYADDVFALACEHNALTGKWVLRFAREDVNAAWDAVVEGTVQGKLGYKAMVSTSFCEDPHDGQDAEGQHQIQIFTHDYTDLGNVCDVLRELQAMESVEKKTSMCYKLNCYNILSIDAPSDNQWKLSPILCKEKDLQDRIQGACKFFDPKKGYGFLRCDNGEEVYVKAYDVIKKGTLQDRSLTPEELVEFSCALDQKSGKPKAMLVCSRGMKNAAGGMKARVGGKGERPVRRGSRTDGVEDEGPKAGGLKDGKSWRDSKPETRRKDKAPKPKAVNTGSAGDEWQVATGFGAKEPTSAKGAGDDNWDEEEDGEQTPKEGAPRSRFGAADADAGWGDDDSDDGDGGGGGGGDGGRFGNFDEPAVEEQEPESESESESESETEEIVFAEPEEPVEVEVAAPAPKKNMTKAEKAALKVKEMEDFEAELAALAMENTAAAAAPPAAPVVEEVAAEVEEGGEGSSKKKKKKKPKKKADDAAEAEPAAEEAPAADAAPVDMAALLKSKAKKKSSSSSSKGKTSAQLAAAEKAAKNGKKNKKDKSKYNQSPD